MSTVEHKSALKQLEAAADALRREGLACLLLARPSETEMGVGEVFGEESEIIALFCLAIRKSPRLGKVMRVALEAGGVV